MSARSTSARRQIPGPGPEPQADGRTLEQRAFLGVGAAFLLAAVGTGAELFYRLSVGTGVVESQVVVALPPLLYLALGWLTLLFGLAKLGGARRRASEGRGPWLAVGALLVFLFGPLPASFALPVSATNATFTCKHCGVRGRVSGDQNYWGSWLNQSFQRIGRAPPPVASAWSVDAADCAHEGHLPWEKAKQGEAE